MTAPASPNSMGYQSYGEPYALLVGKTSAGTLGYQSYGEPYPAGEAAAAAASSVGGGYPSQRLSRGMG